MPSEVDIDFKSESGSDIPPTRDGVVDCRTSNHRMSRTSPHGGAVPRSQRQNRKSTHHDTQSRAASRNRSHCSTGSHSQPTIVQDLSDRLSQVIWENRALREYNERHEQTIRAYQATIEDGDHRLARAIREIQALKNKIHRREEMILIYRATIEDKALECMNLKAQLPSLRDDIANQGSSWSFINFPSRVFDGERAENKEIADLRLNIAQRDESIEQLKAENDKLRRKTAEQSKHIQNQTIEFSQEMEVLRNKISVNVPKISDTEIQNEWRSLGFVIRQFIAAYLPSSMDLAGARRLVELEDFRWVPQIKKTLQAPTLCPIVFESWIWHFLCFRIFDSGSEVWAGETGRMLSVQCGKI